MRSGAISRSSIPRISAVFSRSLGLAAAALLFAGPAVGQARAVVTGRIVRLAGKDTLAAPEVRVVLHRVSATRQGPLDSARTGKDGSFRFAFTRDSAALYLLSARYGGIEHFSDPVRLDSTVTPPPVILLVSDTSSTAPIDVAGRYLVFGSPDPQRNRAVVDLFVLRNAGNATRVARDSATPVWRAVLPAGASLHRVTESGSEISPEAVQFRGDTVLVFAPMPPGTKQLLLQHAIPADRREFTVPLGEGAAQLQVVTEEAGTEVTGAGLRRAEAQVVDGRQMARWVGSGGQGGEIVVKFPGAPTSNTPVPYLVAAMVVVQAAGVGFALRRPAPPLHPSAPPPTRPQGPSVDDLVDQAARLDATYAGRQGQVPAEEWQRYQSERARLTAAITDALAARGARR